MDHLDAGTDAIELLQAVESSAEALFPTDPRAAKSLVHLRKAVPTIEELYQLVEGFETYYAAIERRLDDYLKNPADENSRPNETEILNWMKLFELYEQVIRNVFLKRTNIPPEILILTTNANSIVSARQKLSQVYNILKGVTETQEPVQQLLDGDQSEKLSALTQNGRSLLKTGFGPAYSALDRCNDRNSKRQKAGELESNNQAFADFFVIFFNTVKKFRAVLDAQKGIDLRTRKELLVNAKALIQNLKTDFCTAAEVAEGELDVFDLYGMYPLAKITDLEGKDAPESFSDVLEVMIYLRDKLKMIFEGTTVLPGSSDKATMSPVWDPEHPEKYSTTVTNWNVPFTGVLGRKDLVTLVHELGIAHAEIAPFHNAELAPYLKDLDSTSLELSGFIFEQVMMGTGIQPVQFAKFLKAYIFFAFETKVGEFFDENPENELTKEKADEFSAEILRDLGIQNGQNLTVWALNPNFFIAPSFPGHIRSLTETHSPNVQDLIVKLRPIFEKRGFAGIIEIIDEVYKCGHREYPVILAELHQKIDRGLV